MENTLKQNRLRLETTSVGKTLVLLFCLMHSAQAVVLGRLVQGIDPFLMVFVAFLIATVFFSIKERSIFSSSKLFSRVRFTDLIKINLSTAASWIGYYLSLRYLEPAVVGSITVGVGPVLTTVCARYFRPNSRTSRSEYISSYGIFAALIFLSATTWSGHSAIRSIDTLGAIIGISCSLLTGLGIVGNTIFSKALADQKMSASQIMAIRFYGLLALSGTILFFRDVHWSDVSENINNVALISVLGVILPLYILQRGIVLAEPISVAILLSFAPVIALVLQFFDNRLQWSFASVVGVSLVTAFAILGAFSKKERT